jgi:hypothetical protein
MGARLAAPVGIAGKTLNAHEYNSISTLGDTTGNLGRHKRAIGNKEEEKSPMLSYHVEHIVPQQGLTTCQDNGVDTEFFCFGEESIKLVR